MPPSSASSWLLGGRLAVDFANAPSAPAAPCHDLSWEHFIFFLETAGVVSQERGAKLLALCETDPQIAHSVLQKAIRLRAALRELFGNTVRKQRVDPEWLAPINEILLVTEGHDELIFEEGAWKIEFIAREGGLDWLLAAVARSAAEILVEGNRARLRMCANPSCGLFFCDQSRTRGRRWCSMAICGNRHKVASFARRRSAT